MGLRLIAGIDGQAFKNRTGLSLGQAFDPNTIAQLTEAGFLETRPDHLVATAAGRQRLNAVIGQLLNS